MTGNPPPTMNKSFVFRFVPKPLRLIRCADQPARASVAARTKRRESVRYVPAWTGTQLMPFPVVTADRPKSVEAFYED